MSRRQARHLRFEGDLLRAARNAIGITNEQLAREIDVTLRTIQRWQDGGSQPKGAQLLALADVLHVKPDDFYVDDEPVAV